ncbi:hypothetical protein CR203_08860 [Salipaludibacillus neizhouensis]|uniref:DUF3953 domain-containing protein n=1 Tax=Salipaludibacillus neizhouensis TaxID=885475 RepID=A0A3A9K498_9BACI|nr:DUF3953 domain-containing protein [Salipaludibacillus neizhouensis]RKL67457.1 hypothetical protein CR203_08860 [Salipaludibacillus neizhouensis]
MFLKLYAAVSAIIVLCLGSYSLISQNFHLMPLLLFFLGITLLLSGLGELRKKRYYWGYINIGISLFVFFVSIESFITN